MSELRPDAAAETPQAAPGSRAAVAVASRLPAETRSRAEYADSLRQPEAEPGADAGGQAGSESSPDPGWRDQDLGAQGMTRAEYAERMRQPAVDDGADDAEPADPDPDPGPEWQGQGERAQGMTREDYAGYLRQPAGEEAPDVAQDGDLAPGDKHQQQAAGARVENDEARENVQADVAGVPSGPATGHGAGEQAREDDSSESHRAAEDAGTGEVSTQHDPPDSDVPRGADSSPETDDRIKALLAQLDQTRAELDKTRAERDQAKAELDKTRAERDQAKAELDQASQEIADLKAGSQEQPGQSEDPDRRADDIPDAHDAGRDSADAPEPEEQAEDTDLSRAEHAARTKTRATDRDDDLKEAKHGKVRLQRVASPDNIAVGAALWDAHDAVQRIAEHAMHDAVSPSVAVAIGLVGVAVSKIQERKKEKRK